MALSESALKAVLADLQANRRTLVDNLAALDRTIECLERLYKIPRLEPQVVENADGNGSAARKKRAYKKNKAAPPVSSAHLRAQLPSVSASGAQENEEDDADADGYVPVAGTIPDVLLQLIRKEPRSSLQLVEASKCAAGSVYGSLQKLKKEDYIEARENPDGPGKLWHALK